jgi:hypothetical protein
LGSTQRAARRKPSQRQLARYTLCLAKQNSCAALTVQIPNDPFESRGLNDFFAKALAVAQQGGRYEPGQFCLLQELEESGLRSRIPGSDLGTERAWRRKCLGGELKTQVVQNANKFTLEVFRKDRVGDRPANDGEALCPAAGGPRSVVAPVELEKAIPDKPAVPQFDPAWCFGLKGLPVLVTDVAIADFCCVDHPGQPNIPAGSGMTNSLPNPVLQVGYVLGPKAMLKGEYRPAKR